MHITRWKRLARLTLNRWWNLWMEVRTLKYAMWGIIALKYQGGWDHRWYWRLALWRYYFGGLCCGVESECWKVIGELASTMADDASLIAILTRVESVNDRVSDISNQIGVARSITSWVSPFDSMSRSVEPRRWLLLRRPSSARSLAISSWLLPDSNARLIASSLPFLLIYYIPFTRLTVFSWCFTCVRVGGWGFCFSFIPILAYFGQVQIRECLIEG